MLGTDTVYTPTLKSVKKPIKVLDYPKGETLSIVSSLIETTATPKIDLKNPIPYEANEITVINGPDTRGSLVGEKIALGLAAVLKAIVREQTTINIIAHSRGAVESIILAHELEEIKKILESCKNLGELLERLTQQQSLRKKSKPVNNTPDIIAILKTQLQDIEPQDEWFQNLKNNIPLATINFFGIDPVPGDIYPITWYDERFFSLPRIINNAEIIHYENERTDWGFTPIYPEAVNSEQTISYQSMPGHHGTGSAGNNASQQKKIVSPEKTKTTHVQKLMLYKMLDFLNHHDVKFKDATEVFRYGRGLGRKHAKPIEEPIESTKRIDVSQLDFPKIYRELYSKIETNRAGYRAFNQTNYWMGGLLPQRKMLHTGHKYRQFNESYSIKVGYVNEEHSRLMQNYFFKTFNLVAPNNLAEMIDAACNALKENIGQITPEHHPDVLQAFGIVIQQVSQKYLSEEWSTAEKQEQKQLLFAAITRALATFYELQTSDTTTFFTQLIQLSLSGLINTVKAQYTILKEQFDRLQETPDKKLIHFFKGLLTQLNLQKTVQEQISEAMSSEEQPEIDARINDIVNSEPYKKLDNHPINAKISYTWEQVKNEYPPQGSEFIENLITGFEEQYGEYLKDFEKLYTQTQVLVNDIVALRKIKRFDDVSILTLLQCECSLYNEISPELIKITAQKFYQDRPHDLPKVAINDGFLKLAERYAIDNYGVIDRTQEQVDQKIKDLSNKVEALTQKHKKLQRDNAQLKVQSANADRYEKYIKNKEEVKFIILAEKLEQLTRNYLKTLESPTKKVELCDKKIKLINELLHCLTNTENKLEASTRVRDFYVKLDHHDSLILKDHRNSAWRRYVTNVLIVAGVLLSGILPGLLALAAYNTTGNTAGKSYRFWRTAGTNVTENLKKLDPSKSSSTEKDDKDPKSEDPPNNFSF